MKDKIKEICNKLNREQLSVHGATEELFLLFSVVGRSEQLKAFVDWWHGLSKEELVWYEGRYVEVFLSL